MSELRDNLVLHLKLDSLPVQNQFGQSLGATTQKTVENIEDTWFGKCISFKGESYIEIPYEKLLGLNDFTVSFWLYYGWRGENQTSFLSFIYPRPEMSSEDILHSGFFIANYSGADNKKRFYVGIVDPIPAVTSGIWGSSTIPDTWSHLALTYADKILTFYVNGILQNSPLEVSINQNVLPLQSTPMRIGAPRGFSHPRAPKQETMPFEKCWMAHLSIYNKALSSSEVRRDMAQSISPQFDEHLKSLEEQVRSQRERYDSLSSTHEEVLAQISALNTGTTKADLTAQLEEARSRIADNELKLKLSEVKNTISSVHLKISKLRDSVEEVEKDRAWDSLIKQVQQSAEQSASLSPGSASAEKAKELAESVPKKSKEAKEQASNAIDATKKADQLLGNLEKYVNEFDQLSLLSLSESERTEKLSEAGNIKKFAEQIRSVFDEVPVYSEADGVPENQVDKNNISDAVESIRKQILNARFAANAGEQAKKEAEETVKMAQQQVDEASKIYEYNSQALDQLFKLIPDPEKNDDQKEAEKPEVPAGGTDPRPPQTELKKSLKQLFGLPDSPQPSVPPPIPAADSPAASVNPTNP